MRMTSIITAIAAVAAIHTVQGQTTTEKTTEVQQHADGTTTRTDTTTTTFNPEVRTKVVTYFDAYKASPNGLPPAWAGQVHVKEVPTAWRTTRIAPGVVIQEKERAYLVEAPSDLVGVLPTAASGVHYYVAGSNVVAVDANYRIVDSIQIPTVKFTAEAVPAVPAETVTRETVVVPKHKHHDDDDDDDDDD